MSRPPAWPVLAAYAAALGGSLAASQALVTGVARARAGGDASGLAAEARRFALSAGGLRAVAGVDAIVLLMVAVGVAALLDGGVRVNLRIGPGRATPAGLALAVCATAGASLACGAAAELSGAGHGAVMGVIEAALRSEGPAAAALSVLMLAVAPGVAEELLFRGLMQTRLAAGRGAWPGIVGASAAFGLMHLDAVQGTTAFAVGLVLGWTADRLGSVRPAMLAHASNNALFVLLAVGPRPAVPGNARTSIALLAAGLAALAGGVAGLRSRVSVRAGGATGA